MIGRLRVSWEDNLVLVNVTIKVVYIYMAFICQEIENDEQGTNRTMSNGIVNQIDSMV